MEIENEERPIADASSSSSSSHRVNLKALGRTDTDISARHRRRFFNARRENRAVEEQSTHEDQYKSTHDFVTNIGDEIDAYNLAVDRINAALHAMNETMLDDISDVRDEEAVATTTTTDVMWWDRNENDMMDSNATGTVTEEKTYIRDEGDLSAAIFYFNHAMQFRKSIPELVGWCLHDGVIGKFIEIVCNTRAFSNLVRCDVIHELGEFVKIGDAAIIHEIEQHGFVEWILHYFCRPNFGNLIDLSVSTFYFRFLEHYFEVAGRARLHQFASLCTPFLENMLFLLRALRNLHRDVAFVGDLVGMLLSLCENMAKCGRACHPQSTCDMVINNQPLSELPMCVAEHAIHCLSSVEHRASFAVFSQQINVLWSIAIFVTDAAIPSMEVQHMAAMIFSWLQYTGFAEHIVARLPELLPSFVRCIRSGVPANVKLLQCDGALIQGIVLAYVTIIQQLSHNAGWTLEMMPQFIPPSDVLEMPPLHTPIGFHPDSVMGCIYAICRDTDTYADDVTACTIDVFLNALINDPRLADGFIWLLDGGALVMGIIARLQQTILYTKHKWRTSAWKFILSLIISAISGTRDQHRQDLMWQLLRFGAYNVLCSATHQTKTHYDFSIIELSIVAWQLTFEHGKSAAIAAELHYEQQHIDDDLMDIIQELPNDAHTKTLTVNSLRIFKRAQTVMNLFEHLQQKQVLKLDYAVVE